MPVHPVELILMRELAGHLSLPIFVVDPVGDLLFYNEPAEELLGSRFEETGPMVFAVWSVMFMPTNGRGQPIEPEQLPLSIALNENRPASGRMWIRRPDGGRRRLEVTAFPLSGQWGKQLGAAAIFWEVS